MLGAGWTQILQDGFYDLSYHGESQQIAVRRSFKVLKVIARRIKFPLFWKRETVYEMVIRGMEMIQQERLKETKIRLEVNSIAEFTQQIVSDNVISLKGSE